MIRYWKYTRQLILLDLACLMKGYFFNGVRLKPKTFKRLKYSK